MIKIAEFPPEECGWVHKGGDVYERPDGKLYIFPPGRPHLIAKLAEPMPRRQEAADD